MIDSSRVNRALKQSETFRAWYEKNAEDFNRERKERYHKDPDYRKKVLERAAEYRQKVAAGHIPKPRAGLFTTATVASIMGVSTQTIRNWEARGTIPKATLGGSRRLYTPFQVSLMKKALTNPEFRQLMFEAWE